MINYLPLCRVPTSMNGSLLNMKISIVGTAGIPANYGGFETLAQNLVEYHKKCNLDSKLIVYCSKNNYDNYQSTYLNAKLKYIPLNPNGIWSVAYDIISILDALIEGSDVILILGVSGAILFPLVKILTRRRIVVNVDGIEWRRDKWGVAARWFLRFSEYLAVKYSDITIADNEAISDYLVRKYAIQPKTISYGGDHTLLAISKSIDNISFPLKYALSICRVEPENNLHLILDAFAQLSFLNLVIVGNWSNSEYGKNLYESYLNKSNLFLLDPIYDLGVLKNLRENAMLYVHGHSAGGTNPSLVEAMHFGLPILTYDCIFNRYTTENSCFYFNDVFSLKDNIEMLSKQDLKVVGRKMKEIANRRYTWDLIAKEYFVLMGMGTIDEFPKTSDF